MQDFKGRQRAKSSQYARSSMSTLASTEDKLNVLVVGGGGREHALCWGLARSVRCGTLFCAPGNPGIASDATCVDSSELDVSDNDAVVEFCKEKGVSLVVVGPEAPLVDGLVDVLRAADIPAFGPTKAAAQIEGSKAFMKDLCKKYDIPTAAYEKFTDVEAAKSYIRSQGAPIVIKTCGLAAGKGVIVAMTEEDALQAVEDMLVGGAFGSAGAEVVIEEFMTGEEASFFAIVDGETALPLQSAQDHKRVGDGDTGLNTGGMGAYSPAPVVSPEIADHIMQDLVLPTVQGMKKEGCPYTGVLYAGVMIKDGKARLVEYNARFGDPECQVLIPRLKNDLLEVLLSACGAGNEALSEVELQWTEDSAVVVVMAAEGYPGPYKKGTAIGGVEAAEDVDGVIVFHAGTAKDTSGQLVSAGGRVLGVTAIKGDVRETTQQAYAAVDLLQWPEGFCRRDIAWRAIERLEH